MASNAGQMPHGHDFPKPAEASPKKPTPLASCLLGYIFVRMLPGVLFYLPSFIIPAVTLFSSATAAFDLGNSPFATICLALSVVWYAFGLVPVFDRILGNELRNPTPEETKAAIAKDGAYRVILYAYVAAHFASLALACHLLCSQTVPTGAFVAAAVSCGVGNGLGFTVAHELLHDHASRLDHFLSKALLCLFAYQHWTISHLKHHIKVATPEDPSSARRGETLWAFIPRSVLGNIADGYGAEASRCHARGISFFSPRNRALGWVLCPLAVAAALAALYGWAGVAFYALQASVGVLMLETVNYLEHYGLQRAKLPNGRYERVSPRHSWNATSLFTNATLFRLQRHSDHHANAERHFQLLRDMEDAPQLPGGYPVMMLLSTVPPLFFKKMDPLVDAAQQRDKESHAKAA